MNLALHTIELENFKSFRGKHSFNLERAPGVYYITGINKLAPELGANGVGKSTLWDALLWVLSNKTGRDNRPGNAIVPWGLAKAKTSVTLTFTRHKTKYVLTRSRNPNDLKLNGKTVEQAEVWQTLGMSEEAVRRTLILGQFGTLFLDLKAEQQSQLFNEALNLDLWLKASAAASAKLKTLTKELDELTQERSAISGRKAEVKISLKRERTARDLYEEQRSTQLAKAKRKFKTVEQQVQGLISARSALESHRLGEPKEAMRYLEKETERLRAATTRHNRTLISCKAEAASLASALRAQKSQYQSYKDALDGDRACPECGVPAPKEHLKAKAQALAKAIALTKEQLGKVQAQTITLEQEMVNSEVALAELNESRVQLNSLLSELDRAHQDLEALEKEGNPYKKTVATLKARLAKLETDFADTESKLAEAERVKEICSFWTTSFKEIRLSLIDQVLTELEMAVTNHVERLGLIDWKIKFNTERITLAGDVSTVFNVLLYPPDQDEPVRWENYSGGESQRWQLAVAFGLSEVLLDRAGINPNLEIYDEPTRGLSKEGIEDLLEHLQDRAIELNRAILFCDHHSLERGMFNDVITIVKDEEGSHVKEVKR